MDAAVAATNISLDAVVPMIVSLVRSSSASVEVLTDTVAGVVPLTDRAELRRMVVTAVMTERQFSAQLLELTGLAMRGDPSGRMAFGAAVLELLRVLSRPQ
jgi:hypothetical protein